MKSFSYFLIQFTGLSLLFICFSCGSSKKVAQAPSPKIQRIAGSERLVDRQYQVNMVRPPSVQNQDFRARVTVSNTYEYQTQHINYKPRGTFNAGKFIFKVGVPAAIGTLIVAKGIEASNFAEDDISWGHFAGGLLFTSMSLTSLFKGKYIDWDYREYTVPGPPQTEQKSPVPLKDSQLSVSTNRISRNFLTNAFGETTVHLQDFQFPQLSYHRDFDFHFAHQGKNAGSVTLNSNTWMKSIARVGLSSVKLHSSPFEHSPVMGLANYGMQGEIIGKNTQDTWLEVTFRQKKGWLPASSVQVFYATASSIDQLRPDPIAHTPSIPETETDTNTFSDVDIDIPETGLVNPDAIAVIIGNKNYVARDVPNVDFAQQDARIVKNYLIKTFGFQEENILYYEDATQGNFNSVFGTSLNHKGRIYDLIKPGVSDVFVYYSGHGAPDIQSQEGYFVPVDCEPSTVTLNGYPVNVFYQNLSRLPYKSLTVVIDACFSGGSNKGMLIRNASPIFINVKNKILQDPNAIILTSTGGDQVSSWYPEKKHSLFTYYFLKAIRGSADFDSDKSITLQELSQYIESKVPSMSRKLYRRDQQPEMYGRLDKVLIELE
ncbi:caspase family protein [Rapidithrix thailandica]|uniref:Caspase family protein n=1 Tax=Rapidithrix thailandica TaxID=413964 RepID=A0AAW9S2N5_9BACT